MFENVIYLKDILREAKKQYERELKTCKDWQEYYYTKGSLWYIVDKQIWDKLEEKFKNVNEVWLIYGKKRIRINKTCKWEYVHRVIIDKLWDVVYEMDCRIVSKIFPMLVRRLGKYKSIWEILKEKQKE